MEPKEFLFELGTMARDIITGFRGVIMAKTKWINNCVRYGVQSKTLKDGKPVDELWFDEQRLEAVSEEIEPVATKPGNGGPQRDPVFPSGPSL